MSERTFSAWDGSTNMLDAARALSDAGLTVIPIALDGSKSPHENAGKWRAFIVKPPTPKQLQRMFSDPCGIAVLGGATSGGLEIIDFDRKDALGPWQELVCLLDASLLARLPMVMTPNGYHLYFRSEHCEGNQKLAMERDDAGKLHTKIETRGQGGYVIAPPSPPEVHPTKNLYAWQEHTPHFTEIPLLTAEERAILLDCARSLNEVADNDDGAAKVHTTVAQGEGRPGDDFEAKATWDEILRPHGWTCVRSRGDVTHWRRPGKDDKGISATTGVAGVGGKLYVFSSNAQPFQSQRAYGKFSAYSWLAHGGGFASAARELRAKGYGGKRDAPIPINRPSERTFADLSARLDGISPPHMQGPPPSDAPALGDDDAPASGPVPITGDDLDKLLDDDKGAALCEPTFSRLMAMRSNDAEWQRIDFTLRRHKAAKLFTEKVKKHDQDRSRRSDAGWKEKLIYRENKSGELVLDNCLTNHVLILRHDPVWSGVLAFDEFQNQIVTRRDPPFKRQAGRWGDADALETRAWVEQAYGLRPTTPAICEAILMVSKRAAFNSLQEYLGALKIDGDSDDILDTWLIDFFGAPDTPYTRAVGAKWMIAAAARAYDPGCKVDTVLILEGKQGLKKSRVLEQLCPNLEWFTDGLSEFGSKAQAEEIEGKWIVELGELKGFGKELEQIKAFVTRRAENYRPAYARYSVHSPRKCVFAGTVNPTSAGYFRDETGNRRYWPIECTKQAPEMTKAIRDRLWAEARDRYRAGEHWWIEDDTIQQAATVEQEKRLLVDPWHDLIEAAIAGEPSTSVDEVLQSLNVDKGKRGVGEAMRVGRVLTALKWNRYQERMTDGRRPWRYRNPKQPELPLGRPPDEQHAA